MQFIDNDMDDLFRKAAEDYPLHTKPGDWDKVMQKMEHGQKDGQRKNRSRSKWLLLLLPLLFVCNRFVYVNRDASPQVEARPEKRHKGNDAQSLSRGPNRVTEHHDGLAEQHITGSDQYPGEKVSDDAGRETMAPLQDLYKAIIDYISCFIITVDVSKCNLQGIAIIKLIKCFLAFWAVDDASFYNGLKILQG